MNGKLNHSYDNNVLSIIAGKNSTTEEIGHDLEACIDFYQPSNAFGVLFDTTHSSSKRSIEKIRIDIHNFIKWKDRIVCYAVLVKSDFHFGLANQFRVYAEFEGIDVRPFYEVDEALAWIQKKLALNSTDSN